MKSKNKKNKNNEAVTQPVPVRQSQEITNEYTNLCAELGNSVLQFEMSKSQAFARFQALNSEMILALDAEKKQAEQLQAQLNSQGEKLVELVADKVLAQ